MVLLFCVVFLSMSRAYAEESYPYLAQAKADNVIVRAGQNLNFEILCHLKKGDEVVVLGESYEWFKIKLPIDANSYISSSYVKELWDNMAEITANRVNVRADKDVKYSVIGQLSKGDKVLIKDRSQGWFKIEPPDQSYGWVRSEFLEFKSKEVPPARMVELPSRNIYKRKQMVEQTNPEPSPPPTQNAQTTMTEVKSISAMGQIEKLERGVTLEHIDYRLVVDGQTAYYLDGPAYIFEKFINSKVIIEGMVDTTPSLSSQHPIVKITKIKVIL